MFVCQVLGLLITYFLLIVQFGIPFESSPATSAATSNNNSSATIVLTKNLKNREIYCLTENINQYIVPFVNLEYNMNTQCEPIKYTTHYITQC